MARRYDSRTTIFSPEGRLYQVEYAMEAISNAGAAIGLLAKDGVVLAAEKRITSKASCFACPSASRTILDRMSSVNAYSLLKSDGVRFAAPRYQCRGSEARKDVQAG